MSQPESATRQFLEEHPLANLTDRENKVADLICELRKEDGLRLPAPNRAQRIVELLEDEYGVEKAPPILTDLQANGRSSPFYRDSLTFYNDLKGVSEKTLEKSSFHIV